MRKKNEILQKYGDGPLKIPEIQSRQDACMMELELQRWMPCNSQEKAIQFHKTLAPYRFMCLRKVVGNGEEIFTPKPFLLSRRFSNKHS